VADNLSGYRQTKIPITDKPEITGDDYYFNVHPTGLSTDTVAGTRFEVTERELEQADVYEASANYKRITVTLSSGATAWVYVSADSNAYEAH
jgi:gamma-glutamylcyclotransferase (GGCT)/AIG2-like uncharacterized protein YtfP